MIGRLRCEHCRALIPYGEFCDCLRAMTQAEMEKRERVRRMRQSLNHLEPWTQTLVGETDDCTAGAGHWTQTIGELGDKPTGLPPIALPDPEAEPFEVPHWRIRLSRDRWRLAACVLAAAMVASWFWG